MERGRPQSLPLPPGEEWPNPQTFPLLLENESMRGDIQGLRLRRPFLRNSDPCTTFPTGAGALEPEYPLLTPRNGSLSVPNQFQPQSSGTYYAQGLSTATVQLLPPLPPPPSYPPALGHFVPPILSHGALHGTPPRGPSTVPFVPSFRTEFYNSPFTVVPVNLTPPVGLTGTQMHFEGSGVHARRQTVDPFNCLEVDLNPLQGFLPSVLTQATSARNPNCAGSQWNYQDNPHTPTDKSPPGAYSSTPCGAGHPTDACSSPSTPTPILWHFPKTSNTTHHIDLQGRQMEQTCRSSDSNIFQSFYYSSASTQAMQHNDTNPHVDSDTPTANSPKGRRRMGRRRVINTAIGSNAFHGFSPPTSTQATSSNNPNPSVSQPDYQPDVPASTAPPYANNTPSTPAEPTPRDTMIACTQCGWEDEDGVTCGHTIDYECQLHFAGVHGIINLPAHTIVSCRWCKPDYRIRRDCFLRHIRETHLRVSRSGRVDRRPA